MPSSDKRSCSRWDKTLLDLKMLTHTKRRPPSTDLPTLLLMVKKINYKFAHSSWWTTGYYRMPEIYGFGEKIENKRINRLNHLLLSLFQEISGASSMVPDLPWLPWILLSSTEKSPPTSLMLVVVPLLTSVKLPSRSSLNTPTSSVSSSISSEESWAARPSLKEFNKVEKILNLPLRSKKKISFLSY